MPKQKKQKGPLIPGFPNKWASKLPDSYASTVETMQKQDMESELLKCEKAIDETEQDQELDAALSKAKEDLKALNGGYSDALKTQRAKIKYLLHVMKLRGYA